MTGVPGSSPVSAAVSGVICPAISSEAQSGGSASHTLSMPKRERSSFEKLFVCRSMSPLPEESVISARASPVSRKRT